MREKQASLPAIATAPPVSDEDTVTRVLLPWRERAASFAAHHLASTRSLIAAGTLTATLYLLLTLAFPLTRWWFRTDDNLGTIPSHSLWSRVFEVFGGTYVLAGWMFTLSILLVVALFSLQAWGIYAARMAADKRLARRVIIGFAILFIAIVFWLQPITSTDLYGYLARSYLIATLHQNPMNTLATMLNNTYVVSHARPPSPYGPLWLLICGGVGALYGENLFLGVLLMKAVMTLAAIGTILMVAWLAEKMLPQQSLLALALFAWSPLLIFEAVGNAHNDIVMMAFVVGSLATIQLKRPLFTFPLLALGIVIKYSVGALIPLWAVVLLMQFCWHALPGEMGAVPLPRTRDELRGWLAHIDWRRVAVIFGGGGALSLAIIAACYAPFWIGLKTFTGLGQQLGATYFNASLASLVFAPAKFALTGGAATAAGTVVRGIFYIGFLAVLIKETLRLLQLGPRATLAELTRSAGWVLFAILVFITFWYQPWYIVWLLPLAALTSDAALRRYAVTFTFGGMLTYAVANFSFGAVPPAQQQVYQQLYLLMCAFAPLLALRASDGHRVEILGFIDHALQRVQAVVARVTRRRDLIVLTVILVIGFALRIAQLGANQWPAAIAGTVTIWCVGMLTAEIFMPLLPGRQTVIALVAALIAATSRWHVVLSRTDGWLVAITLFAASGTLALWRLRAKDRRQLSRSLRLVLLFAALFFIYVLVSRSVMTVDAALSSTPLLLWQLIPFAALGVYVLLRRSREPASVVTAFLAVAAFMLATLTTSPLGQFVTALGFPFVCVVTALGLEEVGRWLAALPEIITGPENNAFVARQQLLNIGLSLLVLALAASTFIWYFAATLPGATPTHPLLP